MLNVVMDYRGVCSITLPDADCHYTKPHILIAMLYVVFLVTLIVIMFGLFFILLCCVLL